MSWVVTATIPRSRAVSDTVWNLSASFTVSQQLSSIIPSTKLLSSTSYAFFSPHMSESEECYVKGTVRVPRHASR